MYGRAYMNPRGVGGVGYFGCWATVTGGTFGTMAGPASVGCVAFGAAAKHAAYAAALQRFSSRDAMEFAGDVSKGSLAI